MRVGPTPASGINHISTRGSGSAAPGIRCPYQRSIRSRGASLHWLLCPQGREEQTRDLAMNLATRPTTLHIPERAVESVTDLRSPGVERLVAEFHCLRMGQLQLRKTAPTQTAGSLAMILEAASVASSPNTQPPHCQRAPPLPLTTHPPGFRSTVSQSPVPRRTGGIRRPMRVAPRPPRRGRRNRRRTTSIPAAFHLVNRQVRGHRRRAPQPQHRQRHGSKQELLHLTPPYCSSLPYWLEPCRDIPVTHPQNSPKELMRAWRKGAGMASVFGLRPNVADGSWD